MNEFVLYLRAFIEDAVSFMKLICFMSIVFLWVNSVEEK